ncbi:MAG: hypothetical protein LBJ95_02260 [Oscillospiraceae bacterium]|nr:hypothetical protein [Oscillospiraceae bacterium]
MVIVQPEYLLDTALDLSQDVAAKIIRRPEGIVPYMTQTRVRVDLPTHPRFEASTTSTSTPMHTARAYREDRGHAGLLLGLPGAEMSAMLRVDAQSGPMDTVAQCVVTVLKVNADCAEREGEWPVDTVLADDREDEPNYLVVVVQSFCTGKIKVVGDVSPEGLDPEQLRGMWRNELRICFRSLDKPDTVIETYNLTLEDGFDATALAARAEIGERPITNRPGHGG